MENLDLSKFNTNDKQNEILKNILTGNNVSFPQDLELYDLNLFNAINSCCNLNYNRNNIQIPIIVDFATELLECNIEYLKALSMYEEYFFQVIKNWKEEFKEIDYSIFHPYIRVVLQQNNKLFLKIIKQSPYLIYGINNMDQNFAISCIMFIPGVFKYMVHYQNDIEIAKIAIQIDFNNIKYVSQTIIEEVVKSL